VRICLMCIDCEGVIFLTVQTGGQDAWAMVDEDAWALVKKKKKKKRKKRLFRRVGVGCISDKFGCIQVGD
jgi:hypothetical protein